MQSVFRSSGQTIVIKDCEKMSNEELCRFLEEKLPALAETVREVTDFNRETVIAFLKLLSDERI